MTTSHPARTALIIRANGNGCVERIHIVPNTGLASLQEAVGGFVEAVRLGNDAIMYINEEGLLHDLPRNGVATQMYHQFYPAILRQEIVGDVIIVGVDPETGEERDHPEHLDEAAVFLAAGHPYYAEGSQVTKEEMDDIIDRCLMTKEERDDIDRCLQEEENNRFIERWSDW